MNYQQLTVLFSSIILLIRMNTCQWPFCREAAPSAAGPGFVKFLV
ncbi:uncharacterized protein EbC_42890 [Erwinia billingiae Eb661]|jgi:hypothetical protein|uniref:Uncharacterized protein n=1 Tax=Erwinia billingiae (strain Eb661) TaxID=634500 RepID=D8MYB3_ERWBE|nr:uncharacterized protein EbC_42890 [Erwinia billingiae Eb661]